MDDNTKRQKEKDAHIRKGKLQLNKGIELILSRRKEPSKKANIILLQFEKMLSLFTREFTIYFEFSFDIRKPQV